METEAQIRAEVEDLHTIIQGSIEDLKGHCDGLSEAIDFEPDFEEWKENLSKLTHEASELARRVPELEALLKTIPR